MMSLSLKFVYCSYLPFYYLADFGNIPRELFSIITGIQRVYYVDHPFGINSAVKDLLGINIFQVIIVFIIGLHILNIVFQLGGVIFLVFLASIALVSVVLPNLYFRVMLYTDHITSKQVVDKTGVEQSVARPGWVETYKDTSWLEEIKRRKMRRIEKLRKYRMLNKIQILRHK
jgi:hypothetical protein